MFIGWYQPNLFEPLVQHHLIMRPGTDNFMWSLSFVILIGIFSLTTILWRARYHFDEKTTQDSHSQTEQRKQLAKYCQTENDESEGLVDLSP